MCSAVLHCLRALPAPGDGLSRFSGGKGWGGAYRPGDGALVVLAAISPAHMDALVCVCGREQKSHLPICRHSSTDESDAQMIARSGLPNSGKDLWCSSRGKY